MYLAEKENGLRISEFCTLLKNSAVSWQHAVSAALGVFSCGCPVGTGNGVGIRDVKLAVWMSVSPDYRDTQRVFIRN